MITVRVMRDTDLRPVEGAEVLVEFHDSLQERRSYTDPRGEADILESGGFGTVYVNGLRRYSGDLFGVVSVRL